MSARLSIHLSVGLYRSTPNSNSNHSPNQIPQVKSQRSHLSTYLLVLLNVCPPIYSFICLSVYLFVTPSFSVPPSPFNVLLTPCSTYSPCSPCSNALTLSALRAPLRRSRSRPPLTCFLPISLVLSLFPLLFFLLLPVCHQITILFAFPFSHLKFFFYLSFIHTTNSEFNSMSNVEGLTSNV